MTHPQLTAALASHDPESPTAQLASHAPKPWPYMARNPGLPCAGTVAAHGPKYPDDVEFIEQTTRDRVILPADLPVEREVIDVPASEKIAADGAPLVRIGEEISIKLGYRPAAFFKRELVRPKYVDPRQPEMGVRIAPLPPQLLDGSLLDATLGAHLLVSKYGDHLPLYRLEQIYARSGIEIPRSTLCDWVIALTDRWLRPLVIAMKEHLPRQSVIHVDETPMPLQREKRVPPPPGGLELA